MDIKDVLKNKIRTCHDTVEMRSGSHKEGFRLEGSDIDVMKWPTNETVIWDLSQSFYYNRYRKTLILCDCSDSPPGYTLLYILSGSLNGIIVRDCVGRNISSSEYRQSFYYASFLVHSNPLMHMHGPCVTKTHGKLEFDYAYCLASDFWPPSASSWIDRSHSWPPSHIVDDIVKSGCHFVAVGHKLGRHEHNEWRISFSLAEQKLVYVMNHCQFLTYGLLKLFLRRIINNGSGDEDKLLCSYHIKTSVFWAIQQNIIPHWCPQNLLKCSWVCFKLILKWVYEGVCPNFFIPSNNMFIGNIYGEAQNVLFIKLYELYTKGIKSLLDTLFIMSCNACIDILRNPRLSICTDENTLISEIDFDVNLFGEISGNESLTVIDLQSCMLYLLAIEEMINSPLTQYQVIVLQKVTGSILQKLAFILHMDTCTQGNKFIYRADKISCHILKFAAKFGCISDLLYIAMYYYKTFRYMKALAIIEVIKVKLSQPYVMHNFKVNSKMYIKSLKGQSWSTKMRQAVAWNISLSNEMQYISELIPEQISSVQHGSAFLFLPPSVLLYMLEIFCCRCVDTRRAQTALYELQTLVHYDQRQFIPFGVINISWHILGICQQVTGNFQDALYSYQQSLREDQLHSIQSATEMRMQAIWQWNN
ncbi:uncharacterized protein LOC133197920 [Saccostrea echinata]|uniref:uncharacterized protein LOC133197920 n=1 Tax=Saccostrea echinata TaxID=191078 RepID=UPI002A830542|nr:uncharacterized protein LOC133197920 [Saccostrea echinata]